MAEVAIASQLLGGTIISAGIPDSPQYNASATRLLSYGYGTETALVPLLKFNVDFESIKYKKLIRGFAGAYCKYVQYGDGTFAKAAFRALASDFTLSTVTWNNAPAILFPANDADDYKSLVYNQYGNYTEVDNPNYTYLTGAENSLFARNALRYGVACISQEIENVEAQGYNVSLGPAYSNIKPWLSVRYDDAIDVLSVFSGKSNTSGYVPRGVAQTFTWELIPSGEFYCYGDWTQASAVFHWREGTEGAWNNISISGSAQSVTIPVNTFPLGIVQWYVSGVDNVGTASNSEIYTISTADSLTVATPTYPISTVEDGSGEISFTWTDANDNGTTPTGADLQYSQDGSVWTLFGHVDGAVTTYTAPGGAFPAGAVMWRVRAYNFDSVAGDWSEAVSFISVAAPTAPTVSAAAVPFTTVTWQSSGQQAYRIIIDGVTYGPFFGSDKTYTPKDYLRDGNHTISVEIQGVYGLWSQAGSVTFTVANAPGDGITLTGSFGRDAALSWTTESATADFLVYRDGKQIGSTFANAYYDRFVLGAHSYQVINRLSNGNYTASNVVNGVMRSCTTAIAPFNGGTWQELKLSENSYSEQRFSWAKLSSTRHVTGAVYPVIEVSEYEDAAGSYDVSFPDVESANAFLALRGQIVILKSRGGNVVIGALTQIEQANKDFYISFAFTIQRIDWEDYVDAQNS